MQTWVLPGHRVQIPGPWDTEPDRAQWVDESSNLDCLILRQPRFGNFCGYVGVPASHPLHGRTYGDPEVDDLSVHGGVTFGGACQDKDGVEHLSSICHIPEPGRDPHVWWLGFDCGHCWDLQPGMLSQEFLLLGDEKCRNFEYVQEECRNLAGQLAKLCP